MSSNKDCTNDCSMPLRFPRRPGTELPTKNSSECACLRDNDSRISQDNRSALSRFNYRIGTYGSIREFLFDRINMTPELQNWTYRATDDPAVALLEGASILGDILTFYQETYANEAFLRTAQWRESISDLVRLLGYRLSPAVGGNAVFAFELKKDEPVVIPRGFPLKATLEMLPKPVEFETTEEITAYPWLNRFNLYRPLEDSGITPLTTEFYISYPEQLTDPIDLKAGDRLLVGEPDSALSTDGFNLNNAEIILIDSIREQHGQKYYKIKGNMKRTSNTECLSAYRLGRTFHHFGYNSPTKIVDSSAAVTSTATVSGQTTSTSTTISYLSVPMSRPVDTSLYNNITYSPLDDLDFPIDCEVNDLPNNTMVVIQASYPGEKTQEQTKICKIKNIRTVTITWGGMRGTVSLLSLDDKQTIINDNLVMHIADTLFHEVTSLQVTLKRVKEEIAFGSGNTLNFYGTVKQVKTLKDRHIMLEYPNVEPSILCITSIPTFFDVATENYRQLYSVTLSENISYSNFPNENPFVTVFGNLVDADEGKTLPETAIGSGDANLAFQNFKLPKAPLTYHIVPENTPSETPEIEIYVDGRQWKQVDSFFGHNKNEQIYIVREDAERNSWVQFGDGKTGARLTSGINNVTAIYRTGDGAYGPLKADTSVQASAKLKNLDKIGMLSDATGGTQPEDCENARYAAPGKVQSLGRIVSLRDFETEAAAIPGVALASAAWELVDNIPAIVITVLMETGRNTEISAVRDMLNAYNAQRGSGRHSINVIQGKRMYVTATIQYALKPTYRTDLIEPVIRLALGVNYAKATRDEDQTGLFSLKKRRFGGREYAASIEGIVQNVEGVLWAKTIAFKGLTDSDAPGTIELTDVSGLDPIVACDSSHILSLYNKQLILSAVKEEGS